MLLLFVPLVDKISASKLFGYVYSHPVPFAFQASLPPDNITLNPANKKIDQSLSDFQTGIGAAIHVTEPVHVVFFFFSINVRCLVSLQHTNHLEFC